MGTTANIDPIEGWKIVDGKLYLNLNREVQKNGQGIYPSISKKLIKIGRVFWINKIDF
jgi:hypothetical protein